MTLLGGALLVGVLFGCCTRSRPTTSLQWPRWHRDRVHFHAHADDAPPHFHAHSHRDDRRPHVPQAHRHVHGKLPPRALAVGTVLDRRHGRAVVGGVVAAAPGCGAAHVAAPRLQPRRESFGIVLGAQAMARHWW